ncbi:MAG: iron-containing alcohol dehydrogenase [Alphaproteobacteria bacterium]|nr:iron-containing alcohol dehydrogenase [Alphaproteobacteria bacterium]
MDRPTVPIGNWSFPAPIRFGAGRIGELPQACRELGIHRPLLVTDPGLAALPMVSEAVEACVQAGLACAVFSDLRANPVEANVHDGVAALREGGHDGIIAFGGGSALDTGKAIGFMAAQSRPIWDFEDREDWWTRAEEDGMVPVVAVPTTSGTGSETGRASVITDTRAEHTKRIIFHPRMMPGRVILDPELTVGLPARLTAAVGMDALSHSLEAYSSPVFHPLAQGIALEAMRLVRDALPVAVKFPSDLAARSRMQVAASMGSTAFQKGLGAMHALSHPCSSLLDTHHGLTNAVVMPYVLVFNRPAIETKMAALARYLDLPDPSFSGVLDWILALREEIGIPHTLKDIDVDASFPRRMAPMAAADPSAATNPVPLDTGALEQLYLRAIDGVL